MSVQIPIQFVGDTTQLEPVLNVFNKLGLLADDELAKFRSANQEFAKRQTIVQQTQGPMDKLAKSAGDVTGNLSKGATNKIIEDLQKKVAALTAEMEKLRAKTKSGGADLDNTLKGMTREWKELTNAAIAAEKAGNKALAETLRKQAAEAFDAVGDLRAEIRNLASDTAALDGIIQGLTGIAAGFQLAQGLSAVFGDKNEELNKAFIKLQGTMAIVNSLQAIQNALQKESALRLLLSNIQRGISNGLERIGIVSKLQTVAVKRAENAADVMSEITYKRIITAKIIENGLTSKSVIVRGLATAAQWALNAAMYANPAVWLALAVGALVAAFAFMGDSAEKAAARQATLNKVMLLSLETAEAYGNVAKAAGKDREAALERELERLKASRATTEEIRAAELKLAEERSRNASYQAGFYANEIQNIELNRQAVADLTAEIDQLNTKKLTEDTDDYDKQIEAVQARIDLKKKELELGEQAQAEQLKASEDLKNKRIEDEKEIEDEGLKSRKASLEAKLIFAKKGTEQAFAIAKALAQAEYDLEIHNSELTAGEKEKIYADYVAKIRKIDEEYQKAKLQDQLSRVNAELATTRKGSQEEFELKKKALELQRDIELTSQDLSEVKKREIIAISLRKVQDLTREFLQKQVQDQLNTQLLINEAKLVLADKGSADELNLQRERLLIQEALELASIDKDLEGTELGEAKKKAIRAKYLAETIDLDRAIVDARLQLSQFYYNQQVDYLDRLAQIEASSISTSFERRQQIELEGLDRKFQQLENDKAIEAKRFSEGIITYDEYQKRLTEITNEQSVNRVQRAETEAQQIYDLQVRNSEKVHEIASRTLSLLAEADKNASDSKISGYERELAQFQSMLDNQQISQEQFNAKKKELDNKIKAEKQQAAQKEKTYAITQILLDTAVAAVKALATPPAPNLVAAGLASAFGIAQAAIAGSRPIPQFAKGTEHAPPGWAWVGERGPELIWLKGGEKIKSAPESKRMVDTYRLADTPMGSATMSMVQQAPKLSREAVEKMALLTRAGAHIDIDRLALMIGDTLGEKLGQLPLSMFSFDRRGFTASVTEGNSSTKFYNDRYSST